jgi:ABC-type lipoprotein release transport system permease subunit
VGEGIRFALLGVTIGVGLALLGARWIEPLLFQQSATDPMTYVIVGGTMILVSAAASLAPARRGARVDPSVALRSE